MTFDTGLTLLLLAAASTQVVPLAQHSPSGDELSRQVTPL